jgi:hypothetical protein
MSDDILSPQKNHFLINLWIQIRSKRLLDTTILNASMNDTDSKLIQPLAETLKNELDFSSMEDSIGTEIPPEVKDHIQKQNLADTIAKGLSKSGLSIPGIKKIQLMYGSGDTGRGTQVIFEPKENTTKDELREQGEELAKILKPIFPADFVLFITHGMNIEDGKPVESNRFHLKLVYNVRTYGRPDPLISDSGEIIWKS